VNGGDATAFSETGNGSTDPLTGYNVLTLDVGTYAITEPAVAGYTTTDNGNCASVVVTNGSTATCKFTNDDDPGTLVVQKTVINDDGGLLTVADFNITTSAGTLNAGGAEDGHQR
jgi:hypothetical protein